VEDLILVCELLGDAGTSLYVEPDAVESVQECFTERTRFSASGEAVAEIVMASGAKHVVKDEGRTVGSRWVKCKERLRELAREG
jgi:hypothetical protein